jgi:hypothetical protein
VTCHKWPTPSLNTSTSFLSLIRYFIWKVKKFLDPQKADITPRLEGDSYCVNFCRSKVNTTLSGFADSNVDVGKSSGIVKVEPFVLTFQGFKV